MNSSFDLILRQVRPLGGALCDIGIAHGKIAKIATTIAASGPDVNCRGQELRPGLNDHHFHLFATAAKDASLDLTGITDPNQLAKVIAEFSARLGEAETLRGIGYDERCAGMIGRQELDQWCPDRPMRLQDRTGALWILNSRMLDLLGTDPLPDCVECDAFRRPTGRVWRGDAWLRSQVSTKPPSLAKLSRQLAAYGVTGVTDAGATNGAEAAALFDTAIVAGELQQNLMVMGNVSLPISRLWQRGPLKLLYDERDFPPVDDVARVIMYARMQGRTVAAHCVTLAETIFFLEALELSGGARDGDRIEHGAFLPNWILPRLAESGLIMIAQPGFVLDRGDRYIAESALEDLPDMQRLASIDAAGIALAGSTDAPYASFNPWTAIRAACYRQTARGDVFGAAEALSPARACALFCGSLTHPNMPMPIGEGAVADLIVLEAPLDNMLRGLGSDQVSLTISNGRVIHQMI